MLKKMWEWVVIAFMILFLIFIAYSTGASIVNDYLKNGIWSVIFSFIIGIPLLTWSLWLLSMFSKKK